MDKKYISYILFPIIIILVCFWCLDVFLSQDKTNLIVKVQQNNHIKEISAIFKVIDGDSLRMIDGQEVRLLDIDAPEYKQRCFDKNNKEYNCGQISTNFLRNLIKNQKLICKYSEKDIYDRYLANCFIGDKNINYEMVKNGMAIIYNIHQANDQIKSIEKQARIDKIGLWQGKFLSPKDFRKRNNDK